MGMQYIDGRLRIQWSTHYNSIEPARAASGSIISTIITIISNMTTITTVISNMTTITIITAIITIVTTTITIITIISTMTCLGRSRAAVPQCRVWFAATVEQRQLNNISQFYHIFVGVSFITFLSESVLFLSKSVFFHIFSLITFSSESVLSHSCQIEFYHIFVKASFIIFFHPRQNQCWSICWSQSDVIRY